MRCIELCYLNNSDETTELDLNVMIFAYSHGLLQMDLSIRKHSLCPEKITLYQMCAIENVPRLFRMDLKCKSIS